MRAKASYDYDEEKQPFQSELRSLSFCIGHAADVQTFTNAILYGVVIFINLKVRILVRYGNSNEKNLRAFVRAKSIHFSRIHK